MFAPNVWSFNAPKLQISHKYSESVDNKKHEKQILKRIHQHSMNQMISIILPDTKALPDTIVPLLKDTDHYQIRNFSVAEFIKKEFIEAFVKKGKIFGISEDTRIDVDNCVCITPQGICHLSVVKDTYHRLGIEGKLSSFAKKHKNRYVIEIDLNSEQLKSTTKYYAQLKNALSNEALPTFTMRFLWEPPQHRDQNDMVCSSSMAKYFANIGYKVELIQTDMKMSIKYGLKTPKLAPECDDLLEVDGESRLYATPHELIEYAGMLALSCNLEPEEYLSTWKFSGHSTEVGSALVILLKGMFSSNIIKMLFKTLRDLANERQEIPWISIYVHGFPNSPTSFGDSEHSFTTNGDNSYAVFVSSFFKCLYCELLSSNKALK